MSKLEDKVNELRAKLEELAKKAQDQAVANEFLERTPKFRVGDFVAWGRGSFRRCGAVVAVSIVPLQRKYQYAIRWGGGESGEGYSLDFQDDGELALLYTREQVEEILRLHTERKP